MKFMWYVTGVLACVEVRSLILEGKLMKISMGMLFFAVAMVFIVFVITGGNPR
jgi:hypothetical protein